MALTHISVGTMIIEYGPPRISQLRVAGQQLQDQIALANPSDVRTWLVSSLRPYQGQTSWEGGGSPRSPPSYVSHFRGMREISDNMSAAPRDFTDSRPQFAQDFILGGVVKGKFYADETELILM